MDILVDYSACSATQKELWLVLNVYDGRSDRVFPARAYLMEDGVIRSTPPLRSRVADICDKLHADHIDRKKLSKKEIADLAIRHPEFFYEEEIALLMHHYADSRQADRLEQTSGALIYLPPILDM